jgi:phage tail tape-measure protein
MSIQVDVTLHEDLHKINKQVIAMSPGLCDACMRAASKGAAEGVANVAGSLLKGAAVNPILSFFQGATNSVGAVLANSFKVGYTATLSATSIGLVSAIALGVNAIIETPLLAYNIYKIHRKQKFNKISQTEMKRQYTVEGCTSAGTVALGIGGAVLGQIVIPIPVVGAAAGGLVGTLAGKGGGYLVGKGIGLFIIDKDVDLSPVVHEVFVPCTQ